MKSELRQDLVSGDWIVLAPGRAKRPREIFKNPPKRKRASVKGCPFENPQKFGNKEAILRYGSEKKWTLQIVENKFPALIHLGNCSGVYKKGPYSIRGGVGHHDLVITRDHNKNFSHLGIKTANEVFHAFRDRYLMLLNDPCLAYIQILANWGPTAGGSIYHPHYQIVAIPVIPPDVEHSLRGSARYFKRRKSCVHCDMILWEQKEKKRIIFQNSGAIAFTPFVSRNNFEIRIFPKKHLSYFENTLDENLECVVEALRASLQLVRKNLKDPDYNFFIHTAPLKNKKNYKNYHWHIEVLPKSNILGGFELGTGIEINTVDPDRAAQIIKGNV